jgi:hypothetical protein
MLELAMMTSADRALSPECGEPQNLDLALLAFVKQFANNPTRWHIVTHLARDMGVWFTAQEMAQRIKGSLRSVRAELDDLVLLGLLETEEVDGKSTYALARDPNLRRTIQRFGGHLSIWRGAPWQLGCF